eukprot:SAG31_NODE_2387_length_5809_cov_1.810683_7_plen_49_part_00
MQPFEVHFGQFERCDLPCPDQFAQVSHRPEGNRLQITIWSAYGSGLGR